MTFLICFYPLQRDWITRGFYKSWLMSHHFFKRSCPSFLLSVRLSIHLSVLTVCLSIHPKNKKGNHLATLGTKSYVSFDQSQVLDASSLLFKTLCLSVRQSLYLSICLSICLSVFLDRFSPWF